MRVDPSNQCSGYAMKREILFVLLFQAQDRIDVTCCAGLDGGDFGSRSSSLFS
jgi:hypothetical protein